MTNPTTPNLGTIITSGTARKFVYGVYAGAAVVVGGCAAYFLGTGHNLPEVVSGAQAVVAYLAIPIGGLALANTSSSAPVAAPNAPAHLGE
jgi:xanthine/uracil permease